MRIAVFGAGGVGGYFGARLMQAGEEVAFVARGKHLEAMRTRGLKLRSILGDVHLTEVEVSDDPEDIGPVDVVLLAVKTWQLEGAVARMAALLGEQTFVVPLQNGVEAASIVADHIGEHRVLGGVCKIISHLGEPGEIVHVGATPWIAFGERVSDGGDRAQRLLAMFQNANVAAEISDDIEAAIWEKLLFVASVGGVGAVTRAPIGVVRDLPETRALLVSAMSEVQALAYALGVSVSETAATDALRFVDSLPAAGTSSLQRDIVAGRRSELDAWSGAVMRLGEQAGVPTPVHAYCYGSLLPLELKARGTLDF